MRASADLHRKRPREDRHGAVAGELHSRLGRPLVIGVPGDAAGVEDDDAARKVALGEGGDLVNEHVERNLSQAAVGISQQTDPSDPQLPRSILKLMRPNRGQVTRNAMQCRGLSPRLRQSTDTSLPADTKLRKDGAQAE